MGTQAPTAVLWVGGAKWSLGVAAKWMLAMPACALAFNVAADNYYLFRDAIAATSEYGFQQGWAECTRLHTALRKATSEAEKVQATRHARH